MDTMTKTKKPVNRVLAVVLSALMVITMFPLTSFSVFAETIVAHGAFDRRDTDPGHANQWELTSDGTLYIHENIPNYDQGLLSQTYGTSISDYCAYSDYAEQIVTVVLDPSVEIIGNGAFVREGYLLSPHYTNLQNLVIPANSSLTHIGNSAFAGCTTLQLQGLVFPDTLTYIGGYAFYKCDTFQTLTLPDAITEIGTYAFAKCSQMTSVNIPDSLWLIGGSAFDECTGLTAVYVDSLEHWCSIDFVNASANPLYNAGNLYINGSLFTQFSLPEYVTATAYDHDINSNTNLPYSYDYDEYAVLFVQPNAGDSFAYTKIKRYTFAGIDCLEGDIVIPDRIEGIRDGAFYCAESNINNITIGSRQVLKSAFEGTSNISGNVTMTNVGLIGEYCFRNSGIAGDLTIHMNNNAWGYGNGYHYFADTTARYSIGGMAFANCENIQNLYLTKEPAYTSGYPDYLKPTYINIGNRAFYNCKSLQGQLPYSLIDSWLSDEFHGASSNYDSINYFATAPDLISVQATKSGTKSSLLVRCASSVSNSECGESSTPLQRYSFDTKNAPTEVAIGQTLPINLEIVPAHLTSKIYGMLAYSVADPTILSVAANGDITGLATGTTTITISSTNSSYPFESQTITVRVGYALSNIELDPVYICAKQNNTKTVTPTVVPDGAVGADLTFELASTNRVRIDSSDAHSCVLRVLTSLNPTRTDLTVASAANPAISTTVPVYIYSPNVPDMRIAVGSQKTAVVSYTPSGEASTIESYFAGTLQYEVVNNQNVASIDANGVVTGLAGGTCNIRVTSTKDPTYEETFQVEVLDAMIEAPDTVYLYVNTQSKIASLIGARIVPSGTGKQIEYSLEDSGDTSLSPVIKLVTMSSTYDGVKGCKIGTGTIRASIVGYSFVYKDVTVQVYSLSAESMTVNMNETKPIQITTNPTSVMDYLDGSFSFASADPSIATVNANGNVTGVTPGTTTVTITSSKIPNQSFNVTITVPQPVEDITIGASSPILMHMRDTVSLNAVAVPSTASNPTLSYRSSNTDIATVSSSGVVTAKAKTGEATITVSSTDGSNISKTVQVIVFSVSPGPTQWVVIGDTVDMGISVSPNNQKEFILSQSTITNSSNVLTLNADLTGTGVDYGSGTISITDPLGTTVSKSYTVFDLIVPNEIVIVEGTSVTPDYKIKTSVEGTPENIYPTYNYHEIADTSIVTKSSSYDSTLGRNVIRYYGASAGTTTVTVTHNGASKTVPVRVTGVSVTYNPLDLYPGDQAELVITNTSGLEITSKTIYFTQGSYYISSDDNYEHITATHTSTNTAKARVYLNFENGTSQTKDITLNLLTYLATDITVPEDIYMYVGDEYTLTPVITPENASTKSCNFSVASSTIASIQTYYGTSTKITGNAAGTTTITVSSVDGSGISKTVNVHVIQPATDLLINELIGKGGKLIANTAEDATHAYLCNADTTKMSFDSNPFEVGKNYTVNLGGMNVNFVGTDAAYSPADAFDGPYLTCTDSGMTFEIGYKDGYVFWYSQDMVDMNTDCSIAMSLDGVENVVTSSNLEPWSGVGYYLVDSNGNRLTYDSNPFETGVNYVGSYSTMYGSADGSGTCVNSSVTSGSQTFSGPYLSFDIGMPLPIVYYNGNLVLGYSESGLEQLALGFNINKPTTPSITVEKGHDADLTAIVLPSNATYDSVTMTMANTTIATCASDGLDCTVHGVKTGTTVLTVTLTNPDSTTITKTVNVNVYSNETTVEDINVANEVIMLLGSEKNLGATVEPANATINTMTCASADSSIVSIDANGDMTAHAIGTTTITVTSDDPEADVTKTVTVHVISITPDEFDLPVVFPHTIKNSAEAGETNVIVISFDQPAGLNETLVYRVANPSQVTADMLPQVDNYDPSNFTGYMVYEGGALTGYTPGDAILEVSMSNHPDFKYYIVAHVKLEVNDIMLGTEFKVLGDATPNEMHLRSDTGLRDGCLVLCDANGTPLQFNASPFDPSKQYAFGADGMFLPSETKTTGHAFFDGAYLSIDLSDTFGIAFNIGYVDGYLMCDETQGIVDDTSVVGFLQIQSSILIDKNENINGTIIVDPFFVTSLGYAPTFSVTDTSIATFDGSTITGIDDGTTAIVLSLGDVTKSVPVYVGSAATNVVDVLLSEPFLTEGTKFVGYSNLYPTSMVLCDENGDPIHFDASPLTAGNVYKLTLDMSYNFGSPMVMSAYSTVTNSNDASFIWEGMGSGFNMVFDNGYLSLDVGGDCNGWEFPSTFSEYHGDDKAVSVLKDESIESALIGIPTDAPYKSITATIRDNTIASYDINTNTLSGLNNGSTYLDVVLTNNDDSVVNKAFPIVVSSAANPLTGIEITPVDPMKVGDTADLPVTLTPTDPDDDTLTYTSGDPTIATVDTDGHIIAVGPGEVTITVASQDDPTVQDQITILVCDANLGYDKLTVGLNETSTPTVELLPAGKLTLISKSAAVENAAILEVGENGTVIGKTNGTTNVTLTVVAETEDHKQFTFTDMIAITCSIPADHIDLSVNSPLIMKKGDETSFTATVVPTEAADKTIAAASGTPAVVSIESCNGETGVVGIKANDVGSSIITVSVENTAVTKTLEVIVVDGSLDYGFGNDPIVLVNKESVTPTLVIEPTIDGKVITGTIKSITGTNDTAVQVDNDGKVTGKSNGTSTITAVISISVDGSDPIDVTKTYEIQSTIVPVSGISITSANPIYLKVGETSKIEADVTPANAYNKDLGFTSADAETASVAAAGTVTAVTGGDTTITVAAQDGSGVTATVTVYVLDAEAKYGTDNTITNNDGTIAPTLTPCEINGKTVTAVVTHAESNHDNIVYVDENTGAITAVGNGEAEITLTINITMDGVTKTITQTITVESTILVTGIDATSPVYIKVGDTHQIAPTITPSNAKVSDVTYASSNSTIASVDASGLITGAKEGAAVVTITAADNGGAAKNVEVIVVDGKLDYGFGNDPIVLINQESVTPTIVVTTVDGKEIVGTITSITSDDDAVRVSEDGTITGVSNGTATITAVISITIDGGSPIEVTKTYEVTSNLTPVTGITITSETPIVMSLDDEHGKDITATVAPANAFNQSLGYSSNHENIATVSNTGHVSPATEIGKAIVTVSAQDGSGVTADVIVCIVDANVSYPTDKVKTNSTPVLPSAITVTSIDGIETSGRLIGATSSDESIVTVDPATGAVTGQGEGTATVTLTIEITCDGKTVTVDKEFTFESSIKVMSIEIGAADPIVVIEGGDSKNVEASAKPDNATNKALTYSSDNTNIATVDANGNVSGVSIGTTTVTVRSVDDPQIQESINVIVVNASAAYSAGEVSNLNNNLTPTVTPCEITGKTVTAVVTHAVSGDENKIVVDENNGTITAVGTGDATIITLTIAITVDGQTVTKTQDISMNSRIYVASISASDIVVGVGETKDLNATTTPANANNSTLNYASDDAETATVSDTGAVTGIKAGTTDVTITAADNGGTTKTVIVTVVDASADYGTPTISNNNNNITPTVTPCVIDGKTVTAVVTNATSTNTDAIVVDADGTVHAVGNGEADFTLTITITVDGQTVTKSQTIHLESTIYVTDINASNITVLVGESKNLDATTAPANANSTALKYVSNDTDKATVAADGTVTGVAAGTADVTITAADNGGATKTVTVTVISIGASSNKDEYTIGETGTITIAVDPEGVEYELTNVTITPSNPSVFSVEGNTITGTGNGITDITISGTIVVNGENIPFTTVIQNVKCIGIEADDYMLIENLTKRPISDLNAHVVGLDPSEPERTLIYASNDVRFVTVDEGDDFVHAKKVGYATVQVRLADNPAIFKDITVVVVDAEAILPEEVEPAEFPVGDSTDIITNVITKDIADTGEILDIQVTSSDPAVISYDPATEHLVATGSGTATVTVTMVVEVNGNEIEITRTIPITTIVLVDTLNATAPSEIYVGDTDVITVEVLPDSAANKDLIFTSSDPSVLTVDNHGNIEGKKGGEAVVTITSKDGGASTTVTIRVVPVIAAELEASLDRTQIFENETTFVRYTIRPDNTTDKRVTFSSSDTSIATVDSTGTVRPHTDGDVIITVTSVSNPELKVELPLHILMDPDFTANVPEKMNPNETAQIVITPKKGTIESVEYSSSNNSIASVDENGVIHSTTSKQYGTVTITIKVTYTNGMTCTKTYTLRVVDPHAGQFRCKRCDWWDEVQGTPGVLGVVYWLIHTITHLVQELNWLT